jgi:type I restriction enzyme R subunit
MNKKTLSERDICTKFIAPAISAVGWDIQRQVREEVSFTKGRIDLLGFFEPVIPVRRPGWGDLDCAA